MSRVKATASLTAIKLLKRQDPQLEPRMLSELKESTRQALKLAGAANWISLEQEREILEMSARMLFPGDPAGLRRLGYEVAKDNFGGVYKVFLIFPRLDVVISRIYKAWHHIHDTGEIEIIRHDSQSGTVVIKGMPELPAANREYVCGFSAGILELIGFKQVSIVKDERDPMAWKWHIRIEPRTEPAQPA